MKVYAGLDVSIKQTSVCIIDELGNIYREVKVSSCPEEVIQVIKDTSLPLSRIGLEAGPLSQWLFSGVGPKRDCQRSASKPGTPRPSSKPRSTRAIATMPAALLR